MRRAIVVQADYRFLSALVPKESAATLYTGTRVKVVRDLELSPYGVVRKGETATVSYIDPLTGIVELLFDRVLANLYHWQNCLILAPYDSDDLIGGLALESMTLDEQMLEVFKATG